MSFGDGINWDVHVDEIFGTYDLEQIYYKLDPESSVIKYLFKHFEMPPLWSSIKPTLLDCGCHIGRWCNVFRDAGFHYVGVDQSEYALRKAREHTQGEYHQGFLWDFDLGEFKGFDVAVFIAVLQHNLNEDKPRILKNVHRHLRNGGILFFTESTVTVPTRTQLTEQGWVTLAESCDFELLEVIVSGHHYYVFKKVVKQDINEKIP